MSQRSTSDPAAPTSDYLLLVCSNLARWDAIPDDTMDVDLAGHADLIEDLQHTGRLLHCSPLVTPHEGCEVAVRDERTIVSPEPVLATGDVLAGFYVVRCSDLEEACAIAARVPDARSHHVVVRPLMPIAGINAGVCEGAGSGAS